MVKESFVSIDFLKIPFRNRQMNSRVLFNFTWYIKNENK